MHILSSDILELVEELPSASRRGPTITARRGGGRNAIVIVVSLSVLRSTKRPCFMTGRLLAE
jgi:hypothetical protein